jgi:copper chaperone CopZ
MMKKTYIITNMECPNCAMILESIEDDLPGILRVDASYHKGQLTVEFDEGQVSEAQVLAGVAEKGYTVL